jgi:hypothetical protein
MTDKPKGIPRHSIGGLTGRFKRIAVIYRQFGEAWTGLDWSDQAMIDMYNHEALGLPLDERKNGYFIGKQWAGVTVAMWKEDIEKGELTVRELYEDPRLPHWWLDRVLKGYGNEESDV